jgi:MFS family permease
MESMGRSYLGGSGYALSVWIATASSIVMLLYGYDEVCFAPFLLYHAIKSRRAGSDPIPSEQGILGNVIVSQNFLETMGYPSANILGTITSTFCLGAFLGAMITIWTGDILGRPRQILVGSIIIGIGATIQAASFSVSQIIVGRVVAGIGIGMNTSTAGVWQAETTKMSSRGKMVIIQMVPYTPVSLQPTFSL